MREPLREYRKKRDFGVTSEPRGAIARAGRKLSYVIQKHAATRLHYDFRLELDGTLKSWAVPKGPSLDPQVRRMAVHVEDHPLSYGSFEGVIPKGQYGAGTVIVWDRGEWVPLEDPREGYRRGKLKFELHGEKLRGRWNLVRMRSRESERQEPWLLIKENDEEARPAAQYDIVEDMPASVLGGVRKDREAKKAAKKKATPSRRSAKGEEQSVPQGAARAKLPVALSPQLATLVDEAPGGEGWIYELKFDGYRIVARIEGDDVRLFTRNGNDWTSRLKGVRDEVRALGIESAWLDGEIVVPNEKGLSDFQALQRAFDDSKTSNIMYYVFDMPYFGGHDLRRVPLARRRELLEKAVVEGRAGKQMAGAEGRVRFSEQFEGPGEKLLAAACEKGLEGLIAKRSDSPYTSSRSTAWLKLKCQRRQEFVIAGYTDPKGSRSGFGSLLLGVHDKSGKLAYAGNVGTGFDDASLRALKAKLSALGTDKPPFAPVPRGVKGHWVRPKLVAEVAFTEWTGDGRIRHPVFHGLRTDKDPVSITREEALHDPPPPAPPPRREKHAKGRRAPDAAVKSAPLPAGMRRPAKGKDAGGAIAGLRISNPDRTIDPASGAAKIDLVRYYDAIAGHMLPHLAGRPVALVRAPTGVTGELFFQKHNDTVSLPGIKELDPRYWPEHPAMLEIDTRKALVGCAQMNVVEIHTWNSTTRAIDKPDRVIFDLDPGKGIDWARLLEATALMKQMLDLLELESFLKTSGGKGLHVVVPLTPKEGYDEVKDFAREVVVHMARTIPQLFVAKSGAQNRVGRIFIDYLRNGTGATTVAAFSARARPGLGVSVPVAWSALESLASASQWNIFNVLEHLARSRADPWKAYAKTRQTLTAARKKMVSGSK
jgi:bifunctional non-homologous end joining protein LigD